MEGFISLKDLKKEISSNDEKYGMVGVVEYQGPSVMEREAGTSGHYIAIAYRNGSWIKYDDMLAKSAYIDQNTKLRIELIIYAK